MVTAYLGIGSNKGERIRYIEKAVEEIDRIKNTKIIKSSSVYETEPWGNIEQGDFLNSVVEINTTLSAFEFLEEIKSIERKIGRTETARWSEREIDIDLLFYGNEIIENVIMKVPHPEIEKRKFVLIPLKEIAEDFVHPISNKSISRLLDDIEDNLEVRKYEMLKI